MFIEQLEDRTVPTIFTMPDFYSVVHDQLLNIAAANSVLSNDMEMNSLPLSVSAVNGNTSAIGNTITLASGATLTMQSNGSFILTPAAQSAYTEQFQYTASNGSGSATGSVTITITNMAPTITSQTFNLGHDQVLTDVNPLANSFDFDGDTLQAIFAFGPNYGTWEPLGNGLYNYYPPPNWTGTDSISLYAFDGVAYSNNSTITINVTNTAPTASGAVLSIGHDQVIPGIDLNQYVSDAEYDPLTISIVSGPSHGTFTQNDDETYNYTPASNYVGMDQVSFKGNDGLADSSTSYLYFNVTQYAPTTNNTYTLLHDHTLPNINFALNDIDAMANPFAVNIVSGPAHGTLTQNSDGTWNLAPAASFYGTDSVTISANGGSNVVVTFNVTDNAPVAKVTTVPIEAYEGTYPGIVYLAGVSDSDQDSLSVEIISGPQHGSLVLNSSTGLYDYTADSGFLGRDSFSVRYFDGAQYSHTVSADILVDDATTNFAADSYVTGWAGLDGADTRFNGVPSPANLRQGGIGDCWFVAVEDVLAKHSGNPLQAGAGDAGTPIITYQSEDARGFQWYQVTFKDRDPVDVPFERNFVYANPVNAARPMTLSTNLGNGDWAAILEQAWALLNDPDVSSATAISNVLNGGANSSGGNAGTAIRALTGHGALTDTMSWSRTSIIERDLAYANDGWLVTASERTPADANDPHGLVQSDPGWFTPGHCYAVLEYNANTQMVHLQNPWGFNQAWTQRVWVPDHNQIGQFIPAHWEEVHRAPLGGGNADFWLPLSDFCRWFRSVTYEDS